MTRGIYTQRVILEALTAGTPYTYTVPTGQVVILTHMDGYFYDLPSNTPGVYAGTNGVTWWSNPTPGTGPTNGPVSWAGRHQMNAGDRLTITPEADGGFTATGYVLEA